MLGLADAPESDQETVHQEFKEQLERNEAGWYQTKLSWKGNHPTLPTNEVGSQRRLEQLIKRLQRDGNYEGYNNVIQEQLQSGVIETAPAEPKGKEYYIPHKAVSKQDAETMKLRVVYHASARENSKQPSLNDCLHPGPPLQNLLWNILIRSRFQSSSHLSRKRNNPSPCLREVMSRKAQHNHSSTRVNCWSYGNKSSYQHTSSPQYLSRTTTGTLLARFDCGSLLDTRPRGVSAVCVQ